MHRWLEANMALWLNAVVQVAINHIHALLQTVTVVAMTSIYYKRSCDIKYGNCLYYSIILLSYDYVCLCTLTGFK